MLWKELNFALLHQIELTQRKLTITVLFSLDRVRSSFFETDQAVFDCTRLWRLYK